MCRNRKPLSEQKAHLTKEEIGTYIKNLTENIA